MAGEERLENVNPEIFAKSGERPVLPEEMDDNVTDEIDVREIFGKIAKFNYFLGIIIILIVNHVYFNIVFNLL